MVRSNPPQTAASGASGASATPNTGMNTASPFGGMGGGGFGGASPLSGTGGGGFGGAGLGNMGALLDNPSVQALLGNEEFLTSMIENNPRIQRMMESNPELGRALRNPDAMREVMNAMRNPAAMQEMQRNADRALLSIENHPEGWRMLQSLYSDLDQLDEPLPSSDDTPSAPRPTQPDSPNPNNTALPNPWAPRGTSPSRSVSRMASSFAPSSPNRRSSHTLLLPFSYSHSPLTIYFDANPWFDFLLFVLDLKN